MLILAGTLLLSSACLGSVRQAPVSAPLQPALAQAERRQGPATGPVQETTGDRPATSEQPIAVEGAWARASLSPAGAPSATSAVYLIIRNTGPLDDTLLAAHSEVAEATELHHSSVENGVMRMQPSGPLPIPAGGQLTLEPGGLHVMLIGLRQDLSPGSELELTLTFERANDLSLRVPVRPAGAGRMHGS
jgi:copper(I)-binding protein